MYPELRGVLFLRRQATVRLLGEPLFVTVFSSFVIVLEKSSTVRLSLPVRLAEELCRFANIYNWNVDWGNVAWLVAPF